MLVNRAWYCYRRFTYICCLLHPICGGLNSICARMNCFLLHSRQAYLAIYAGSRLLSLYTEPDWMYTMYSLQQKCSCMYIVHVLFITKISQFSSKKHVASHVPVRKSLPDIKLACSVLMPVRAFIAAKSVVYVFKTQRTPNSVVFLFQVR
jgi:hypothetical protein